MRNHSNLKLEFGLLLAGFAVAGMFPALSPFIGVPLLILAGWMIFEGSNRDWRRFVPRELLQLLGERVSTSYPRLAKWLEPSIPIALEIKNFNSVFYKQPVVKMAGGDQEDGTVIHWDHGSVAITNISKDTPVSLDIFLVATGHTKFRLRADGRLIFGKTYGVDDLNTLIMRKAGLKSPDIFVSPIEIPPVKTVEKNLSFFYGPPSEIRIGMIQNDSKGLVKYELDILDHISGTTIRIPIPSKYRGK